MLFELLINFCILFTFAILTYWPFQDSKYVKNPLPKVHPYLIGTMGGLAGFILMELSFHITESILMDSKHVILVIIGIFGGPIAIVISGAIIGISRIFITDVMTSYDLLFGLNIVVIGIVMSTFCLKYPITFKNARFYFYYTTAQTALLFCYHIEHTSGSYLQLVYFILFSAISFFTVLYVLVELNEHFRKIRHTELLSETDYLTGLYNNRKFHQLTESYITDSTKPFSMISIDIDHFKKVNDVHGHSVGDELLKELGERLKNLVTSKEGYVTRNGGEEFVVLLPDSPPAMGLDLGEKIRSSVARFPFKGSGDQEVTITVSVGVSSYPDNGLTINDLYNAADMALLESKANGRNCVSHFNNQKA